MEPNLSTLDQPAKRGPGRPKGSRSTPDDDLLHIFALVWAASILMRRELGRKVSFAEACRALAKGQIFEGCFVPRGCALRPAKGKVLNCVKTKVPFHYHRALVSARTLQNMVSRAKQMISLSGKAGFYFVRDLLRMYLGRPARAPSRNSLTKVIHVSQFPWKHEGKRGVGFAMEIMQVGAMDLSRHALLLARLRPPE